MKKILLGTVLSIIFIFGGCNAKDENIDLKAEVIKEGKVSEAITISKNMDIFTFNDQFDKPQSLSKDTKKVIFVFKKATGHTMNNYLHTKPKDYLSSKNILFVADISKMPSLIAKYVAIPDLQKNEYSVLLIKDEEASKKFKNEKYELRIMVVSLDNLKVTKVSFLNNPKDLDLELK